MALTNTSQRGLQIGWTRAAFTLTKDHSDKLRAVTYSCGKRVKEVAIEIMKICGTVMDANLCDSELPGRVKGKSRV